MKLLRLLYVNMDLKLLAILIAMALWVIVRRDLTDTQTHELPVRVLVDGAPYRCKLVQPPQSRNLVRFEVTGPAEDLAVFRAKTDAVLIARVRKGALKDGAIAETLKFSRSDLEFPKAVGDRIVLTGEMDPDPVEVRVDLIETRDVAIKRPEVEGMSEFPSLEVSVHSMPTSAKIEGRSTDVNIPEVRTVLPREELHRLVDRLGDRTRAEMVVELQLAPEHRSQFELISPTRIEATVSVRVQETRELEVPVHIFVSSAPGSPVLQFARDNETPQNPWYVPPDGQGALARVRLVFTGSRAALDRIDPQKLVAFVLGDPVTGSQTLPLHLDSAGIPEGVTCQLEKFRLIVEPRL